MTAWAWGVIEQGGKRSVFLDEALARGYAAKHHGVLVPLIAEPAQEKPMVSPMLRKLWGWVKDKAGRVARWWKG